MERPCHQAECTGFRVQGVGFRVSSRSGDVRIYKEYRHTNRVQGCLGANGI